MKENLPKLEVDLVSMLQASDTTGIVEFCKTSHPASIAEAMEELSPGDVWTVLRLAEPFQRVETFSHLDLPQQVALIETLHRREAAQLLADMSPDDRADLFRVLPMELHEIVLPAMAQAEREDIRRLISYEEGSAGAAMTSDYATLPPRLTARQAIEHLREVAPDRETIYYAYVLDENRRLIGFVSLKDLILARRDEIVVDLIKSEIIYAHVNDDQEDAARKIEKYDLLALPVLNDDDVLVGIITYDDAMDIMIQENTEDMEKFMAIGGSHGEGQYVKTGALEHFRNRAPWVFALAILGLVSGFIVQHFEGLLVQFTILAAFMPMLAGAGGNTGSQSATLVIRALALKEVTPGDFFMILIKEFRVSFLLAVLLAIVTMARVFLIGGTSSHDDGSLLIIGLAISLSLGLQVITSTLFGAILPILAARLKLDPAIVASPALTTVVDITGLVIYFSIATAMLGI